MRRILFFIVALTTAVSCFDTPTYSEMFTPVVTYDYEDSQFNSDSLFFDVKYKVGFGWSYLAFYHSVDEFSSAFMGGFLVSMLSAPADSEAEGMANDEYRTNARNQMERKNKYAVFCQTGVMPKTHMGFMTDALNGLKGTCAVRSVEVTNTVAVENAVKTSFVAGDQLILRATGYLGGELTDKAEMKLAEFSTVKDSIVTRWTTFDLTNLGVVDR